jgi:hypothetical protein
MTNLKRGWAKNMVFKFSKIKYERKKKSDGSTEFNPTGLVEFGCH